MGQRRDTSPVNQPGLQYANLTAPEDTTETTGKGKNKKGGYSGDTPPLYAGGGGVSASRRPMSTTSRRSLNPAFHGSTRQRTTGDTQYEPQFKQWSLDKQRDLKKQMMLKDGGETRGMRGSKKCKVY